MTELPNVVLWVVAAQRDTPCLFVTVARQHGCSISTWFTTPNVIIYLSLPVPPSPSRIGGARRSRLGLTSIAFDDATLCSLLPDGSNVPALSASFAIEAVIPPLAFRRRTKGGFYARYRGINKPARRIRSRRGAIQSFERSLRWDRTKPAAFRRQ